jgi:hypothetical protein
MLKNSMSIYSPTFPSTCIAPDQPGYGQLMSSSSSRRRARRNTQSTIPTGSTFSDTRANWNVIAPRNSTPDLRGHHHQHSSLPFLPSPFAQLTGTPADIIPEGSHGERPMGSPTSTRQHRYAPYPVQSTSPRTAYNSHPHSRDHSHSPELYRRSPNTSHRSPTLPPREHDIVLPPIRSSNALNYYRHDSFALPPISALDDMRGAPNIRDSKAVLQRLREGDDSAQFGHTKSLNQ